MAKKTYRISGKVIDRNTQSGQSGLRVEAWDKDLIFNDLVGSAVTNEQGAFLIEFDQEHFQELFVDRRPDLFFKVFAEGQLKKSTEDSVLWNAGTNSSDIVIEVDFNHNKLSGNGGPVRFFTVSGVVREPTGEVRKRQAVVAFDLDLLGVAVYRTVNTLTEIKQNGGFELLGQAVTDNSGVYEIDFYDFQYAKNERSKADAVVYAVSGDQIIGRSRIVNSEPYSAKGQVSNLDVFISSKDTSTEYETLVKALHQFLNENQTTLANIARSSDQLSFTAGELDLDPAQVKLAAAAQLLIENSEESPFHQLLYGIGRQNIALSWPALAKKSDEELAQAVAKSTATRIIRSFTSDEVSTFLKWVSEASAKGVVDDSKKDNAVDAILANALPETQQRVSFINALRSFKGTDFSQFWNEHLPAQPEFKGQSNLISNLLLTQQLLLLSGNHAPLMTELQTNRKIGSATELLDLEQSDWEQIISKTGVPAFVDGKNEQEKARRYANLIQGSLNAAFPTQRIARMVAQDKLPITSKTIKSGVENFLAQNEKFDLSKSRIQDYEKQITAAGGEHAGELKSELKRIQRTFQVSPSPAAMTVLMENKLDSATTIASIPQKSFIKEYSGRLGGEDVALAVHQRASHISTRTEFTAMHLMEYSHREVPRYAMDDGLRREAMEAIEGQVPNYAELFGGPDICECGHCNSVFGAAAYYVDLLRFLWRSAKNDDNKSPLDMLSLRRPDLVHLPLTCENTDTIIPYIDLANEVMEYYTAHGSLASFKGYDTGESTEEELRANPQNFNLEAYRVLKGAKYPFTLPYHQPLDVIRTFSQHIGVSRYEVMKAVNPLPNAETSRAIAAESPMLCHEEYQILTKEKFNADPDTTALHEYFGYTSASSLENLSEVREFLRRSGVAYTDLVELVNTSFINPFQPTLDFLQNIFSLATIDSSTLYARLKQIAAGTLDPANDADIVAALNAYNAAAGTKVTTVELDEWITKHFSEFDQVITLFEPDSKCDLDTTSLRTIKSIYENLSTSGVTSQTWSKLHRFIRLWRKLGWTIHETDLMLAALGETDIAPATISKLESVMLLKDATKLAPNQLAVFWGNIDSYGEKSLYRKLFLNRSAQQIDKAFQPDAWGNYLQANVPLAPHTSAIVAAFKITEEELTAILKVARVISAGNRRVLDPETDILNIENLSTIYRYVMLAKGLKMKVGELCTLITMFGAAPPFSIWDIDDKEYVSISPADTYAFYQLAAATKTAGFNSAVLDYIVNGTVPADSNIGLTTTAALQAVRDIRATFAAIEQDHPEAPATPLTSAALAAELSLTFPADVVGSFIGILESTTPFETVTENNLNVVIPNDESTATIAALVAAGTFATNEEAAAFLKALSTKYTYVKGSGRLTCVGTATDLERDTLKALADTNANFDAAVDELYAAPETLIATHFSGIFNDLADANAKLLDHPAQTTPPTLDEKLAYVYAKFTPILKAKLRSETIARHIAALTGLTEAAAALLVASDVDSLIESLSTQGFSADYFSDANWVASALQKTDGTIDFSWGAAAPDTLPADNFSVSWEAYLAAPASGDYTLTVETTATDAFNLYLDDALKLQKITANPNTSWDVVVKLNASQMSRLKLEYSSAVGDAGVKLFWKTTTTAMEIVPANVTYPASIVDDFITKATTHHRAAQFVLGFKLSETELNHLLSFGADFGNIDFKALDTGDWQRIYSYTTLRNAVPQAQALLTDVFARANTANPLPTVADLKALLYLATAWDQTSLDHLVDTHFALTFADFKNEIALNRVFEVMKIVSASRLSATTVATWGKTDTDFNALDKTAQLLKNGVKAKYEDEDWLQLAADLTNKIRERQRDSLVAYLLTKPAIQNWGAEDADGLFEYLLIDVQMGACMDTSRIVQVNASVQMFVNRCLLNLESDLTSSGSEKGVSPGSIDKERWEWMKNYRVWEANRKIFVYPENWLEPEWRNDRSEFFKDLESYLVQNDLTDRNTEQAFRNYLTSLHQVANLEVCGIHRENYESDGHGPTKLKYLHVFARTHNAPYKFFYRTWNEYRKWSVWETVPVDIRVVEEGDDSGVSLVPVVWKGKLILFWPEFIEKQTPPSMGNKSGEDAATDPLSTLEPQKYWEVRLAWSEYIDGKWAGKQVSKEFVKQSPDEDFTGPKDLLFTASIDTANQLIITITDAYWNTFRGDFTLTDIQSPVSAYGRYKSRFVTDPSMYRYRYSKRLGFGTLGLMDDPYLGSTTNHYLLPVDTFKGLDITLDDPFFFSDAQRTYFVRPVPITIPELIRDPGLFEPVLPGFVDDSRYYIPIEIPRFGPDDYFPIDDLDPAIDPGRAAHYVPGVNESRPLLIGLNGVGVDNNLALAQQMNLPATGLDLATKELVSSEGPFTASMATVDAHYIESSFGNYSDGLMHYDPYYSGFQSRTDTGLEFHTFYHPFSSRFVTNLNQGGMASLMQSDTTIPSDNGAKFESTYGPNFANGFVQKPSDFNSGTYYKENICFWNYGANSLYNMELFFHAPLYIAIRLSKNGQYEEAMKWFHYIFDPTTDDMPGPGESEISRYWKVPPFKTTPAQSMEDWFRNNLSPNSDPDTENAIIGEWRDNPFDPHLVASNRPLAYMKHVVVKYVENLVAWGDSLFRRDTMESVNEALQIYVIANHILGPYPESVPRRGEIKAESFDSLRTKWDDFSNALVELENIFPYSSQVKVSHKSAGTNLLGVGSSFYFCIPSNEKLLELWDTVADRLFKIRNCQNIDGVERHLALFAPPIDPAALVMATSQGLSLGSILADLSSPPPIYRFSYLVQKANEFCGEVKSLGASLLSVLEKKDGEELARLRATHETQMSELMIAIKERQLLDAKAKKEGLEKSRAAADFRFRHYLELLGNDGVTVPDAPVVNATLTSDSQLPADTAIAVVQTDVDESLVDSAESGVKFIPRELAELDLSNEAMIIQKAVTSMEGLAGLMNFIPNFSVNLEPLGCGASISYGGSNIAGGISGLAKGEQILGNIKSHESTLAAKMATYIRREQDWTLQANLAAREIIQLDKQITSADIQIQVAEKELENQKQQIENAKEVELFLKEKFTNQELYQWMKEQLFAVYKQSYNLAYDLAKKAEKAYKYELGTETASFIQYSYWDNSKQGLVAGEKLQLALRQLEKSYFEENRRELELSKSISLAMLDPLALIELKETGKCYVSLPEELFDFDFPGHYFRRIKSLSVSIPCIAGPYTTVNCSLHLLSNDIRVKTSMNSEGKYEHEHDEGLWIDDVRFRTNNVAVTSIATSTAQNDTGLFEFNFRDERYLPFEGSGVISNWKLELATEKELRQFDYSTISDVILHVRFTARESGGLFKDNALIYLKSFIRNPDELPDQPLMRGFSMKHEFPSEWYKFLHPEVAGANQELDFVLGQERFPFFAQNRVVTVMKIDAFARCTDTGNYLMVLSLTNRAGAVVTSSEETMQSTSTFGALKKATLNATDAGLNLAQLNVKAPMSLKLKRNGAPNFRSLTTQPPEVDDVFLVVHYKVADVV